MAPSPSASSSAASPLVVPDSPQDVAMRSEALQALSEHGDLNVEGFESSRVFALIAQVLQSPPPGITKKRLLRQLGTLYLFVVLPNAPLDPSNPRAKPREGSEGGGALKPAVWYADLKKKGVIGVGQPPRHVLGTKRKADVVLECIDRDLMDLAAGRVQPQKLFEAGRLKIKGNLDRALRLTSILSHERSKLYGENTNLGASSVPQGANAPLGGGAASGAGLIEDHEWESGAPAPRSKL